MIDRALYLPESWADDPARRGAAGVPEDVAFATCPEGTPQSVEPKLGREMLARVFAASLPCAWVTADSVYGADYALRRFIEKSGRGYVVAVPSAQRLGVKPVADWLEGMSRGGGG